MPPFSSSSCVPPSAPAVMLRIWSSEGLHLPELLMPSFVAMQNDFLLRENKQRGAATGGGDIDLQTLRFVCDDGKTVVPVHAFLFAAASKLVRSVIKDSRSEKDGVVVVHLPGVSGVVMQQVASVVYTGTLNGINLAEGLEVIKLMDTLGIRTKYVKKRSSSEGGAAGTTTLPIVRIESGSGGDSPTKRRKRKAATKEKKKKETSPKKVKQQTPKKKGSSRSKKDDQPPSVSSPKVSNYKKRKAVVGPAGGGGGVGPSSSKVIVLSSSEESRKKTAAAKKKRSSSAASSNRSLLLDETILNSEQSAAAAASGRVVVSCPAEEDHHPRPQRWGRLLARPIIVNCPADDDEDDADEDESPPSPPPPQAAAEDEDERVFVVRREFISQSYVNGMPSNFYRMTTSDGKKFYKSIPTHLDYPYCP